MTNIPKEEDIYVFKVVILGDTSSGKVQFISRFCEGIFEEEIIITTGLNTKHK